jgi:nucleoside-diphosphate-sugar epimerase
MSRVLIAGCGDVGVALGLRLAADGHEVWGLRRRVEGLPAPIRPLAADLCRRESLDGLPPDLDHVVYLAAAGRFDQQAYRDTYVHGIQNLLAALRAGGQSPRRLLYASSTAVYGQSHAEEVDEESVAAAGHFSGRCLLEAEAAVLTGPYPACVARLGGIYGPGRNRLVESVRRGEPCVAEPAVYTNRIHRDDAAGVFHHLLALPDPEPLYLGVDCDPAPQCQVMDWLAQRLGVAAPPRATGSGSPQRGNKRCRNRRLLASGYRFLYPSYREGYAALLQAREA